MPAMSPRRSSRARTTQPANDAQNTQSSTPSTSSSRTERNTRSQNKTQSPQKSTTPRSRSSEEEEEAVPSTNPSEPPQTRQRKQDISDDDEDDTKAEQGPVDIEEDLDDEEEEEEEVTRCICGQQDYPGLPIPLGEIPKMPETKLTRKETKDPNTALASSEVAPEEMGGLFIQCDTCKVWQHGGCVGIMDESISPDEYYCELCRTDLHKVFIGANGLSYSRYLPVVDMSPKSSRGSSRSKDFDFKDSKGKSSRLSVMSQGAKRRSTMNSRDAAYDEEEQLRRAIEASKGNGKQSINGESSVRRGKRGRSDSEETSNKRQRTTSESPSLLSHSNRQGMSQALDSDDENTGRSNGGPRRVRGAAARGHRDREVREQEREKERQRMDAAGRRKGRAERRRGDESDPSDDIPLAQTVKRNTEASTHAPEPSAAAASATGADTPPPTTATSHRKTGRPPANRRSRIGRNQYTRDRDVNNDGHSKDLSPDRSASRDGGMDEGSNSVNGISHHHNTNGESGKPSKPRYMHPHRTTMNEMKRRVAAILEFISRTQVELAEAPTPPSRGSGSASGAVAEIMKSIHSGLPSITVNRGGGESADGGSESDKTSPEGQRPFAELSSLEMMDVLTRKLVLWQQEYGKYGEK